MFKEIKVNVEIFRIGDDTNDIADFYCKTEILDSKNTVMNMRNSMNEFKSRINIAMEKTNKLEDRSEEFVPRKNKGTKRWKLQRRCKDRCRMT